MSTKKTIKKKRNTLKTESKYLQLKMFLKKSFLHEDNQYNFLLLL